MLRVVTAGYLAVVVVVILMPQPVLRSIEFAESGLLSPGWLADALRNILLFLPLGVATFLETGSVGRSIAISFGLAIGFELIQTGIPGRFSSPLDVVSNSLGGGLGAWLARHHDNIRRPAPMLAAWLSVAATVGAILVLMTGCWMLTPRLPDGTYFGGWTPELGHLAVYKGSVIEALLGSSRIPSGGPARDGAELRRKLRGGAPLEIQMRVGARPEELAPVVTIHDQDQHEILLVGIDGDDLVARRLLYAAEWGLENPSRRWRDALQSSTAGEVLSVRLELQGAAWRAEIDQRVLPAHAWTPGRGWALLVPSERFSDLAARSLDVAWIAMLTFPAAFYAERRILPGLLLTGIAATMAGIPFFGCLAAASWLEWLGFVGAACLGLLLGGRDSKSPTRR